MKTWSVYLVRCADDTLYCGISTNVVARIAKHDAGKGAKYTRGRGPVELIACRTGLSHGDALRLEMAVKKQPKDEKQRFLEG